MAFSTFIIGIAGNWYDALQTQGILGLSWQQFAFSLFAVAIFLVVIDLEIRYRTLEKAHPHIKARPLVSENKRIVLEVTNDGFGGDFSAKARIRKGSPFSDSFDLQWETTGQIRNHIDGGGGEETLLIEVKPATTKYDALNQKPPTFSHSGELQLLTVKQGQPHAITLYSWRPDGTSKQAPYYECEIEITITSEPTLLKPFKQKPYKIKLDGLGLNFEEILIPGNKAHQT